MNFYILYINNNEILYIKNNKKNKVKYHSFANKVIIKMINFFRKSQHSHFDFCSFLFEALNFFKLVFPLC